MEFEQIQETIISILVALVIFIFMALAFGGRGHKFLALLMVFWAIFLGVWLITKREKPKLQVKDLARMRSSYHQEDINEATEASEREIENIWKAFWQTLKKDVKAGIRIKNMEILGEIKSAADKLYSATSDKITSEDSMARSPLEHPIRLTELERDLHQVSLEAQELKDKLDLGTPVREWKETAKEVEADEEFMPETVLKEIETHYRILEGIIIKKHMFLNTIRNKPEISQEAKQDMEKSANNFFQASYEAAYNQKPSTVRHLLKKIEKLEEEKRKKKDVKI